MGILTTLFRSLENPSTPLSDPDQWLMDAVGGGKAESGINVNRQSALTYAAVWRAVNLIAGDVGFLPCEVFRRIEGGKQADPAHPAYKLIRWRPNRRMNSLTWRQTMMGHVLLQGNGYSLIERRGDGVPMDILVLNPNRVTPMSFEGDIVYVYTPDQGEPTTFLSPDIIHIKGLGFDGLTGYDVLSFARDSLGLGLAQQKFGNRFFRNSANPSVAIEVPGTLTDDTYKRLRESWRTTYSGLDNAGKVAILEENATVKPFSISPENAQLIESRQFEIREVANWFGVPPHRLGDMTRTSRNSLEEENLSYLSDLDTWLRQWELELRDKLLTVPQKDRDSHFVEFDRMALVETDSKTKNEALNTGVQGGYITRNEARARLNLNPVDGGDDLFVPLNMGLIQDGQIVNPQMAPDDESDKEPAIVPMEAAQRFMDAKFRQAVRRVALHIRRASKHPDKFLDALDKLDEKHSPALRGLFGEISEFCEASGEPAGLIDRMLAATLHAMRDEALELSGECFPAQLEARIDELMADWEGRNYETNTPIHATAD